jgi:hypothetical protein
MPLGRIARRQERATPVTTARWQLGWDELDHEPRLERHENPSQARDANRRSLAGLESRYGRLAQAASARQRVLAPWDSQSGDAKRGADLGESGELGRAVALHPIGHGASKHAALYSGSTCASHELNGEFRIGWRHAHMRRRGIANATFLSLGSAGADDPRAGRRRGPGGAAARMPSARSSTDHHLR